jgi:hypothetical protein
LTGRNEERAMARLRFASFNVENLFDEHFWDHSIGDDLQRIDGVGHWGGKFVGFATDLVIEAAGG